jgi:3-hydroxybutyrate dehydrogenase
MLRGKSAIVTGSTGGIGLVIARALAQEGCDLMINGFGKPADLESLRKELIGDYGVRVLYSGADVGRRDQVEMMIEQAESAFGTVDILVNNAGIQHTALIEDFPPQKWDEILNVNLSSAFHTIRRLIPGMKKQRWGRIVNIASVHGLVASTHKSAYVAAKHGLVGLTKVVALEAATDGVTCNAICPGFVRTPLVEKQIEARAQQKGLTVPEAAADLLGEKQPTLTFVTPEAIAGLVVFLCGPMGSTMTGGTYTLDGGWTAR